MKYHKMYLLSYSALLTVVFPYILSLNVYSEKETQLSGRIKYLIFCAMITVISISFILFLYELWKLEDKKITLAILLENIIFLSLCISDNLIRNWYLIHLEVNTVLMIFSLMAIILKLFQRKI